MRRFAAMTNLELFSERLDIVTFVKQWEGDASKRDQARLRKNVRKGLSKDSMRALTKLTERVDGELRIVSDPPLISPVEEWVPAKQLNDADATVRKLIAEYASTLHGAAAELLSHYEYVHLARKVVGVGSVGTRALIVLMRGSDDDGDPLFLQVKEAQPSVLEPFTAKSRYRRHGRRVVEGQWRMQAAGDIFLGWLTAEGVDGVERDFYVRQLWDWKTSADVDAMTPKALRAYGRACAWTLARAHARTGDRFAIAAYVGKGDSLDKAMTDFAARYADQNERDHQVLLEAVEDGRLEVAPEEEDALAYVAGRCALDLGGRHRRPTSSEQRRLEARGLGRDRLRTRSSVLLVLAAIHVYLDARDRRSRRSGWGSSRRRTRASPFKLGFLLLGFFPTDILTSFAVGSTIHNDDGPLWHFLPFLGVTLLFLAIPSLIVVALGDRREGAAAEGQGLDERQLVGRQRGRDRLLHRS